MRVLSMYQAFEQPPAGSLGRAYFDHCRSNAFPLPGERGGAPEMIGTHDMAHVLGDYDTDPAGEMQVAAFTAGFRDEQTASILIFALCQFDLGVRMVPQAAPEFGTLDPDLFLAALVRGGAMKVDLFGDWSYWPVTAEPVETLREQYGIAPKA